MEKSFIRYCEKFDPDDQYVNYKKTLDLIEEGNVMIDGPKVDTPEGCKITLKEHQKRIVYEMLQKEKETYRVSRKLNLFVITDKVGSGKSINVLGFISHKPRVNSYVENIIKYKPDDVYNFIGYKIHKDSNFFRTNLIVVPHTVYHQWIGYIENFPNLTYYGIKKITDIEKMNLDELMEGKYDIVLVKSTKYNKFMDVLYEKFPLTSDYHYVPNGGNSDVNSLDYSMKHLKTKFNSFYNSVRKRDVDIDLDYGIDEMIEELTKIKSTDMNKVKDLWKRTLIDQILNVKGPIFDRVFFDEGDSIKIPNCRVAYGKYNWFITSSLNDLFFPRGSNQYHGMIANLPEKISGIYNHGFIKNTFLANQNVYNYRFLQDIYLKNNDKFAIESFELEEPVKNYIMCYTPAHLKILENVALPNIIDALNAGDMETALGMVGGNVKSDKDISTLILANFVDELKGLKEKINEKTAELSELETTICKEKLILQKERDAYKKYMENKFLSDEGILCYKISNIVIDDNDELKVFTELKDNFDIQKKMMETLNSKKYSLKNSIKNFGEKVENVQSKHDSLKERITDVKKKNCPICLEKVTKPTIVPCCKKAYCFECLMYCLSIKNQCALCRSECKFNECTIIGNNVEKEKMEDEDRLPTKIEKVAELLSNKAEDKRFLIFSKYDNSFQEIVGYLEKNEIPYHLLKGSTGRIQNIIKEYADNKVKILLLNAKFFGAGLNLQMTSDIIMYHRMDKDLEKQIIGRGQRIGRKGALRVHYLCHDNEV